MTIKKAAGMTSGNKKWTSWDDLADWSSMMIPRLMDSFNLETWFPLRYQLTDDLDVNTQGRFKLEYDEEKEEWYGLIQISADLIAKKDILATLLHELIHAHCLSRYTLKYLNKEIKRSELEALFKAEHQHEGLFGDLCREAGFGHSMRSTEAKPALIRRLLALDF